MLPPFSSEQFFDVFRLYNLSVWPIQSLLVTIGVLVAVLAIAAPRFSRLAMAGLVALWLWMALAYHLVFFTKLTTAAYLFAGLFLLEALLLAWHGLWTHRLHLATPRTSMATLVGTLLVAFAIVGYPLLAYRLGQRYPGVPTFGLPCPTLIFTFGVLAWCAYPVPRVVLVIPAAWALVGSTAAMQLGVPEDYSLLLAAALGLIVMLRPPRRRHSLADRLPDLRSAV